MEFFQGTEPVRLSPGWEGTGKTDDELNFKSVTMDHVDLELNPPKDRSVTFFFFTLYSFFPIPVLLSLFFPFYSRDIGGCSSDKLLDIRGMRATLCNWRMRNL